MRIAVYPGSFDPITNGHIDILKRSLKIFDKVIILIAINPHKKSRFSLESRIDMIEQVVKDLGFENVIVDFTDGYTVKYAKEHNATHLIRGLRAVTDYEYESYISSVNSSIDQNIDMVFFMASKDIASISSSAVMEMLDKGEDISHLVPETVSKYLRK